MRNEKDDTRKGQPKPIQINIPISEEVIRGLKVGDFVEISGTILCGRDAVLPKMVKMVEEGKNEVLLSLL